jgi:hypothetical protein
MARSREMAAVKRRVRRLVKFTGSNSIAWNSHASEFTVPAPTAIREDTMLEANGQAGRHDDAGPDTPAQARPHPDGAVRSVLVLGASYGSLLGTRLLMAGHSVTLVCTRPTAREIEHAGTTVRFPVGSERRQVEVHSASLPGILHAATPDEADVAAADLVVLAMQEPQLAAPVVKALVGRIAMARKPCLAIMNMPPLPFLARLPGLRVAGLEDAYLDADVWRGFDPALVSLASPDAQAFRPPGGRKSLLQVGLATNFKAAPFAHAPATAILSGLADDIERSRCLVDGEAIELPVKLRLHDSLHVPLAKWPMLLTGNYRCIGASGMVSIADAVHGDLAASASMYAWVSELCRALGAAEDDLVPFEKYARAAASLRAPSSAARAIDGGATAIERVDRLVQRIAAQYDRRSQMVDAIVERVDRRLRHNRDSARPAFAA